jgi:hypothetical protein
MPELRPMRLAAAAAAPSAPSEPKVADEVSVLETSLAAVKAEYDRVKFWLEQSEDSHPFEGEAKVIATRLSRLADTVAIHINDIESNLEAGDLATGWHTYAELRADHMPRLANELLAVIGGVYLKESGHDSLAERAAPGLSFSEVARGLLDDLSRRTEKLPGLTLIVGEERQAPVGANIIRLRYPGCELWNLPFTAHEFGYLIGQGQAPPPFDEMKRRVRQHVDPREHPDGGRPDDARCYLPAVQDLWNRHYEVDREDKAPAPSEHEQRRLRSLTELQVAHLCRLFADAFATFFVGPAYVRALLYLHLRPDESLHEDSATMPAFTRRFVFAHETLLWMNKHRELAGLVVPEVLEPFAREVDPVSGLQHEWAMTLAGARQEDRYKQTLDDCKRWLDEIQRTLYEVWRGPSAGPLVFKHWKEARELENNLPKSTETPHPRPHSWAVINAAWSARVRQGENYLPMIKAAAIRLLDPKEPETLPTAPGAVGAAQTEQARARDIELVNRALRNTDLDLLATFVDDTATSTRQPRSDIIRALKPDRNAADAYMRLCGLDKTQP